MKDLILEEHGLNPGRVAVKMEMLMDFRTNRVFRHPAFDLRVPALAIISVVLLGGCTGHFDLHGQHVTPVPRETYEVRFSATRLKDHSSLASGAVPVALGRTATVRTSSVVATEDMPAVPRFVATLSLTKTPGLYQLVTKTSIREAARNKKGKLKFSKRNQGSLLPIRLGETQMASVAGDPVQVEVRLLRH